MKAVKYYSTLVQICLPVNRTALKKSIQTICILDLHSYVAKINTESIIVLNKFRSAGCIWMMIEQAVKNTTYPNNEETRKMGTATNLLIHSQPSLHLEKQIMKIPVCKSQISLWFQNLSKRKPYVPNQA